MLQQQRSCFETATLQGCLQQCPLTVAGAKVQIVFVHSKQTIQRLGGIRCCLALRRFAWSDSVGANMPMT
jgi:hypothetical protein